MKLEDVKVGQFLKPNAAGIRNGLDPNFLFCVLKIYETYGDGKNMSARYWDSRDGGKIVERGGFTPKLYDLVC
jgi:hypothetical protein